MNPQKFENVNLLDALRGVMAQNTTFYQSDFRFDEDMIWKGALSNDQKDKSLIWFCRPSGTCCFREWDTFMSDTWANSALGYYAEQEPERILAYAAEVTCAEGDYVFGNLYPLDFAANWKDVQQSAVRPEFVEATFQNLIARSFPFEEYTRCFHQIIAHYGRVEKQEYLMSDPKPLERLLAARREARAAAPARNLPAHIRGLRERKVTLEAQRLLEELRKPAAPNSPDKAHFAAEVSSWFMALSDEKDRERLSRLLPFPSLELTAMEGKNGLYAVIAQSEDRGQPLRPPSILKKLRQGPAAPPARGRAKEPPER